MLKQKDLLLLKKDEKVDHFLIVKKCEVRTGRTNKAYYYLTLGDKTSSINANIWDDFEKYNRIIKCGDIIRVKGSVDEYQGSLQVRVKDIETDTSRYDVSLDDFIMKSSRDFEEMRSEFFTRLNSITDVKLKTLLCRIYNDKNFNKFSQAPAGKQWHHAYLHGLLEHTLEVIKICDLLSSFHPELNHDLLVAGAMLHDYGKVEELSYDTSFEYTDKGKLLGHIVIASIIINEEISKIPDFPEELKNCLLHMVLSHQGKLEFASPVVPKTLEAITLYHADELSAKVNAYKNALQAESKSDNKWTKWLALVSTDLFNHGIITDEIPEEGQPDKKEIQSSLFDKGE